jgi:hypothetical protein
VEHSSAAVDQIREPVTDCASDEQSGDRLLRRILAYEIAGSGALLVEVCRRLRRLIAGFARHLLACAIACLPASEAWRAIVAALACASCIIALPCSRLPCMLEPACFAASPAIELTFCAVSAARS